MKTISIVVPCYNEEENVQAMADALRETFKKDLPAYRYEILFIDNDSKDRTREIIRKLCAEDKGIKGIFNAKNFGQFNSPYYAMLQTTGDATVLMAADFQDPVEMIPRYVKEWENGYKIVIGIKKSSQENKLMYWPVSYTHLVESCMRTFKEGGIMELGACTQLWNYLYIDDAVNVIVTLLTGDAPAGVYNVAGEDTRPLREYIAVSYTHLFCVWRMEWYPPLLIRKILIGYWLSLIHISSGDG